MAPRKNVPMCVVRIGYGNSLLMPVSEGTKLIALLQQAVQVNERYIRHERRYAIGDQPEVEMVTVKADQIVKHDVAADENALEDLRGRHA